MRLLDYREVLAASVEMALKDHEMVMPFPILIL